VSFAIVNGVRVVEGSIGIPDQGLWVARVFLEAEGTISTSVALVIGNLTLTGAVFRQGAFAGRQYALLVAGAAGWMRTVAAQAYEQPGGVMLSTVLGDAAREVGEQVNASPDRSVGAFFVRESAPAQRVLRQLVGVAWYVDNAGVLQLGARPAGAVASSFLVEDFDRADGLAVISTEDEAAWLPGQSFTSPTVPDAQAISFTRFEVDNAGVLRLKVLVS
jgi:hypothetical protein